jgi:hypothetical protein
MIGNRFLIMTFYGTIAGILLACFFYFLERILHINLFTFLLNIDFLPLPYSIIYSFPIQFVLHIFISMILIAIIDMLSKRYDHSLLISIIINTIMSFTFFPLLQLAISKPFSPPLILPFSLWLIGHIFYAVLIGVFVNRMNKKKEC